MPNPILGSLVRWLLVLAFVLVGRPSVTPALAQTTVAAPVFSVVHGFSTAPFELTLTTPTSGATIRYTLDFSTPTPTTGTVYAGPILINGTAVVRAVAYTSATLKSPTVTQTYVFLAGVKTQPDHAPAPPPQSLLDQGWPAFFAANDDTNDDTGPFPADYGMDPDIVNHPSYVNRIDGALTALPSISVVTDQPNLWDPDFGVYYNPSQKDGDPGSVPDPLANKWERPISIEWIDPSGGASFTENGGLRIHGQASRRPKNTPKKTLRIYFKAAYGTPRLDFPLFDHNDPVAKFDRIVLRNGGNRSWMYWDRDQRRETDYANDEWSRRTWLQMGHHTAHGTYAHLYINGLYWGMVNVTERLDEKMLSAYFGGKDTDYDYITTDEDFDDIPVANSGTLDAFNALVAALGGSAPISNVTYQQVSAMMDMENFADYLLHTHYIGKTDWPNHNWNLYRKRVGSDTRFRWMTWDNDSGLNKVNQAWDSPNAPLDTPQSPSWMFLRLITNLEFRQLFADRIYQHVVAPDGVLTPANCSAVYTELTNLIDQAVIAESARWGDYSRDVYHRPEWDADPPKGWPAYLYSRDLLATDLVNGWGQSDDDPSLWGGDLSVLNNSQKKSWVQVRDAKLSTYCPGRGTNLVGQYIDYPLYQTALVPPNFSQRGGAVAANYSLAISNPNSGAAGDIYYTVDGSDPRAIGGVIAVNATLGGDAANVVIAQVTRVKARIKDGATWSPLMDYLFYPPQPFHNLVINEIHYNPLPPAGLNGDNYEFIELHNAGAVPLRLDNVSFTRGVSFRFPYNATLPAGGFFVLASDAVSYKTRYGVDSYNFYRGNLSNTGETIEIKDAVGNLIDRVDYKPGAPWPTSPNGTGPSLQLNNPMLDNALAANWHASPANDGNPGAANQATGGNLPPSVSISAPANGSTVAAGVPVNITADASDLDGTIVSVSFQASQASAITICTDITAPYSCEWMPSAPGSASLTASATDNSGAVTASATINITVDPGANLPPSVSISAPIDGSSTAVGSVLNIAADASDLDGTITQVVFNANGAPICSDTTNPYTCNWTPSAPGSTSLTAIATDNLGATTTSAAVTVNVTGSGGSGAFLEQGGQVVIEAESFHSKVARSGDDWQATTSPAGFAGAGAMIALPNNGGNILSAIPTTSPELIYQANFATPGVYNFWVRGVGPSGSDDSIHVGSDGIVRASPALSGASWFWKKAGAVTIGTPGLHSLHIWMREDGTSVDKLLLTTASTVPTGVGPGESPRAGGNLPPSVSISSPANGSTFAVGTSVNLSASASDLDGSITQVVFQVNGSPACTDSAAPFTCDWTSSAPGNFSLTAVATDNTGATTSSAAINVTILAPNTPPTVSITAPADGASGTVGTAIGVIANAADSDGSVTQVVFAANGVQFCVDTSAPFTCDWTPSAPGSTSLTAIATDNVGATTTSAAVTVNVTGSGGSGAFLEQGGQVVIEAENFHSKVARSGDDWQATTSPAGFAGAGAMITLPNNGGNIQSNIPTTSPEMTYQVQFATTGVYYFWVRAAGPTGSDDSLHVGTDGVVRASPAVTGATWLWKKAGSVTIGTAGLHTLHIWMREDGTPLDKLLLTKGTSTPSGVGPSESPRGG